MDKKKFRLGLAYGVGFVAVIVALFWFGAANQLSWPVQTGVALSFVAVVAAGLILLVRPKGAYKYSSAPYGSPEVEVPPFSPVIYGWALVIAWTFGILLAFVVGFIVVGGIKR